MDNFWKRSFPIIAKLEYIFHNLATYIAYEIADKLKYISNDITQRYPFCGLQLGLETFGNSTNQSKFNKIPQSCKAKK